jgi:hypothetical protein
MARFYLKVALFGLLVLFCILFGVSLATKGMERIQGPIPPSASERPSVAAKSTISPTPGKTAADSAAMDKAASSPATKKKSATEENPVATHDSSMNRVGNKLGGLLQITAHHGIELFVSIFDALLGKG